MSTSLRAFIGLGLAVGAGLGASFVAGCRDSGSTPDTDGGRPCGCPEGEFCVDDVCVQECVAGREPCGAGVEGEATCCPFGDGCCSAARHGYDFDVCAPTEGPCPLGCAVGQDCGDEYCRYDAPGDTYECTAECEAEQICGESVCCPLGTRCDARGCPLPDLTVDAAFAAPALSLETIPAGSCTLAEGCVGGAGPRLLLRFNTRTPNVGSGALHLGDPNLSDLFEYSPCHGHHHFTGYADYELRDLMGNVLGAGHKQAFCLVDLDCPIGTIGAYRCDYQGISAGCADIYSRALDCQWIDVTDVPSGRYYLVIDINRERRIPEADYGNNRAEIPVVVCRQELGDCEAITSCPGGCTGADATCCTNGDPCAKAGDGVCDCSAAQPWDTDDCTFCDCPPP